MEREGEIVLGRMRAREGGRVRERKRLGRRRQIDRKGWREGERQIREGKNDMRERESLFCVKNELVDRESSLIGKQCDRIKRH